MRFLIYSMDPLTNTRPSPEAMAELGKVTEESKRVGVLLANGGLAPSTTRVRSTGGKLSVTDGPFTEAKELTGGFAIFECKSRDEAAAGER